MRIPSFITMFCTMLFLLMSINKGQAQAPAADARIRAVYGSYTDQLSAAQLAELNARLQRSSIKLLPFKKEETYPALSQQRLITKFVPELKPDSFSDPAVINPLKYNLGFHSKEDRTYRLDGTDYVLVIAGKNP